MAEQHDRELEMLSQRAAAREQIIARFEDAHRRRESPPIDDYLAGEAAARQAILVELVHVDLECRLKAGEPVRVEQYLHRYPELVGNEDTAIELICAEHALRRRAEPAISIDEFCQRFPQYGTQLVERLGQQEPSRKDNAPESPEDEHTLTGAFPGIPTPGPDEPDEPTGGRMRGQAKALRIRCPHCHNAIELVDDKPLAEITCPSCGSSFGVVGDEALAHQTKGGTLRRRTQFGHFELLEQVGSGAWGAVWKAQDTQLHRTVAVKIPRHGQLTQEEAEKFLREARAAAQLRHANIVSVHEVGVENETIYIVSDFIDGVPLNDWLSAQQFTPRETAELCAKIAEAMHHAHEQGVIHRDLKPSNVLLDKAGQPYITDFGLAKREAGEITVTLDGEILGTPAYMSPEQARGEGHRVDRRADVYSLGVVLFQLLTGELPFRGNVRMLLKQVLEDDPPSPRKLNSSVPRDMETICLKCLEKEPSKRYLSARHLGDDLWRHLRGEAVLAHPIGRVQKGWRWCRRNPVVAVLVAAVITALLLGTTVSSYFAVDSQRQSALAKRKAGEALAEKQRAEEQSRLAKANADRAQQKAAEALLEKQRADEQSRLAKANADQAQQKATEVLIEKQQADEQSRLAKANADQAQEKAAEALAEKERAEKELLRSERLLYASQIGSAQREWEANDVHSAWQNLNACREDFRGWEYDYLYTLFTRNQQTLKGHADAVLGVAFSPDGRRIVSASADKTLKVWDASSGQESLALKGHTDVVTSVAFSPNGKWIVSGSGDKTLKVWDAAGGQESLTLEGHTKGVTSVAFSPDGKRIVSGSFDETVKVWDVSGGQQTLAIKRLNSRVTCVAFSPDGTRIVSGSPALKVWDATSGQETLVLKGDIRRSWVFSAAFSPDGARIVSGGWDGTVRVWDAATGQETLTLPRHTRWWSSVAFSSDGKRIVGGNMNGTLRVWDAATGQEMLALQGHTDAVTSVALSPDGKRIVSGSGDNTLKLWDASSGQEALTLKGHTDAVMSVAFSPGGKRILSGSFDGTLKVWDATRAD